MNNKTCSKSIILHPIFIGCIAVTLLFGLPVSAHIVSFITKSITPSASLSTLDSVDYYYTISSWSSESDNQPNPCANNDMCYLFVSHRHEADGTSGAMDEAISPVDISGAKTIGDARRLWIAKHPLPLSGITVHSGHSLTNECVGIFYSGMYPSEAYEIDRNRDMFPTSICGIAPPPTGHCQFSSGNIMLDYGSVSPENLNGRQVSATVTVSCNASMNLEAWLLNPDDSSDTVSLRKDDSIKARLTLDGESAATSPKTFSVTAGGSQPLRITSEAIVSGTPEAGEFSGSAVLFLAVP